MNLSIFGNDSNLGAIDNDPAPACLWGDPYRDASGAWACPSVPPGTSPVPPLSYPRIPRPVDDWRGGGNTIYILPAGGPTPANGGGKSPADSAASGDTIFGLPKFLVYIAAGGAALYLMSTMDGKK